MKLLQAAFLFLAISRSLSILSFAPTVDRWGFWPVRYAIFAPSIITDDKQIVYTSQNYYKWDYYWNYYKMFSGGIASIDVKYTIRVDGKDPKTGNYVATYRGMNRDFIVFSGLDLSSICNGDNEIKAAFTEVDWDGKKFKTELFVACSAATVATNIFQNLDKPFEYLEGNDFKAKPLTEKRRVLV